jgi:hypothetical protein
VKKKISADSANGSNRQAAKQFGHLPMRKRWHRIHDTEAEAKPITNTQCYQDDHLILNMISSEQLTLKVREKKPAQKN